MTCPYSLSRPGGVQGQVLGLARELRSLGVDVRVVAPCDGPPPEPGIICVGPSVEWESNGSISPIATGAASARRTIEAVRDLAPDLVHMHEPAVPGPNLPILMGFKGPMVGTFHIAGDMPQRWVMPVVRVMMQRLVARVAVSSAARDLAQEFLAGEYTVLWNGIDVERYAVGPVTESKRPAVLFIGRHEPRKGLDVLLDAWETLDRDAVLWVVGSGPQTEDLRRRRLRNVEWLGVLPDDELAKRLRGATVFCAPSRGSESFGLVLLEAMAAGAPVVASDIEGYRNVARPEREAVVFRPDDPNALRDALRRVLDDAPLRASLAGAARARADEFSMRRLAEAYVEVYERAMALV
ncbi:MAG: phosphatidyl-myo-inositol alpha-mannosyltransferase [Actinomycetota bacterium]|nr:phosphatidyl-myo-inositol alpha-mannosyltransferase [Actinomycetota bacterium]